MPVSLDYAAYDLGGMTSAAAGEAIPDADFVVLPTGSVELPRGQPRTTRARRRARPA